MKILFTGGGSGGHFYPLVAIMQEVRKIEYQENLVGVKLYFASPTPYNKKILFDNDVSYKYVPAGKLRNYFSIKNFFDIFKTGAGVIKALITVFSIFPDVVVGKGGFGSFPVLLAARIFKIPIIIHESDTRPGRVNVWASKFASRIAISWPDAKEHFPKETWDKIAYTGHPVRDAIKHPAKEGAAEYLKLSANIPTVFIIAGSQGAKLINDTILEALPNLLNDFQVIHQVGRKNLPEIRETVKIILEQNPNKNRYKLFDYLDDLALRMSAGISNVIVTRGGSTLFEVAHWKRPAIIIPITESVNNHQRENAYAYARAGGAIVMEERNVEPSILMSEIKRLSEDKELSTKMGEAAYKELVKEDAARKIALEALEIAISHIG